MLYYTINEIPQTTSPNMTKWLKLFNEIAMSKPNANTVKTMSLAKSIRHSGRSLRPRLHVVGYPVELSTASGEIKAKTK